VQERTENRLELMSLINNFLNRTQMVQQLRQRIEKWDYMKLKIFCTSKEMVLKLKRVPTEWGKICQLYT
jgi:hypothetical protein